MNDLPPLPKVIFKDKLPLIQNELQCYTSFRSFLNLQHLNLSGNRVQSNTVLFILRKVTGRLTHLVLNYCEITRLNSYFIFSRIAKLPCVQNLQHLELENNPLRDLTSIRKVLKKCSGTLKYLSLKNTRLTDGCVSEILKLLEPPFSIKWLYISGNGFSLESEKLLYTKDKLNIIDDYRIETILNMP